MSAGPATEETEYDFFESITEVPLFEIVVIEATRRQNFKEESFAVLVSFIADLVEKKTTYSFVPVFLRNVDACDYPAFAEIATDISYRSRLFVVEAVLHVFAFPAVLYAQFKT